jgi:hypothetical protein
VSTWHDWRMAVIWLMVVGVASMIYFLPAANLVQ